MAYDFGDILVAYKNYKNSSLCSDLNRDMIVYEFKNYLGITNLKDGAVKEMIDAPTPHFFKIMAVLLSPHLETLIKMQKIQNGKV